MGREDDEDDAIMLQAKQQISNNVISKRKEQLRRWQSSEMNGESARRNKKPRVQFQDSDIFLSACMSGDEEEVEDLLSKGADINTCTIDGLTALHQSVIDSKPEMVRFLCEKGADVNAQDNEGWTPLHAAACCGNVAIVKYLCQHGADLTVVNSDKELALDLADDEQCRDALEKDYERQKIDIDGCRERELTTMMRDAQNWISCGEYRDVPHGRTGGTALHVAAARGYIQLLELLIKAGGNVHVRDKDGWTPLHAAAHWAEKDACKILIEHNARITDVTFAGQDVLTVADKEIVEYLEELAATQAKNEKRKSPAAAPVPASVLQEKNHRSSSHDEHILSSDKKKDLQHKDQINENDVLRKLALKSSEEPSESRESSAGASEKKSSVESNDKRAPSVEQSPLRSSYEKSPSVSVSRSLEGSMRSSERESTSRETSLESSNTGSSLSSAAGLSSQRSVSMPPSASPLVESRSSFVIDDFQETSSLQSGDQDVSATLPMVPPPRALNQAANSWINRGVQLVTRSPSSANSRSTSSSMNGEGSTPPSSLQSQQSSVSASTSATTSSAAVPSVAASASATPPVSAKHSPSPAGSVTVTATFTRPPGITQPTVLRSSSIPTNLPWASLWSNVNNASQGLLRSHMSSHQQQLRSSAFSRPLQKSTSGAPSTGPMGSPSSTNVIAEYPRGFQPQQINPVKMSRWQSKTVTESEAERRNNSRMQRQHRRSTQGVTKEQLEEASRQANEDATRRNSTVSSTSAPTSAIIRLASEERDLTNSDSERYEKDGDVSATVSMPLSSAANPANVRRKSQALSFSRTNRRGTGPVMAEDVAQAAALRQTSATTTITPSSSNNNGGDVATSPTTLRLSTTSAPYATGSPSSAATTSPRVVSATISSSTRFGTTHSIGNNNNNEKAQSLPPPVLPTSSIAQNAVSQRSAVVSGLSTAPNSTRVGSASSRFGQMSNVSNSTPSYLSQNRPVETNLNYKALYEKERVECDKLRREMDDLRRAQPPERGSSTANNWRVRNSSPSSNASANLTVAKSSSLASFDDGERRSLERKISDLESQLKTVSQLRMENQRLKEENGALVRVISKMTI